MKTTVQKLGLVVIVIGVISLAVGIVFIQQGFVQESWLVAAMDEEQIAMPDGSGTIVNDSQLAQKAGDLVREHAIVSPPPTATCWAVRISTPPTPPR